MKAPSSAYNIERLDSMIISYVGLMDYTAHDQSTEWDEVPSIELYAQDGTRSML